MGRSDDVDLEQGGRCSSTAASFLTVSHDDVVGVLNFNLCKKRGVAIKRGIMS